MNATVYRPSPVQEKTVAVLNVLFAGGALGVRRADVLAATRLSQADTTRYLAQLEALGLAEQVPGTDHWRPGVRWSQLARAQLQAIARDRSAIDEFEQRVTRVAR